MSRTDILFDANGAYDQGNNSIYEGSLKRDACQLAELYVFERGKFTMMRDGKVFMPKNGDVPMKLTNGHLRGHLLGTCTVGVFAGQYSSKFMTFDVDAGGEEMVRKLLAAIEQVTAQAGYPGGSLLDYVHVSFSGRKGYHVDIFFDGLVYNRNLKKFYDAVISAGRLSSRQIEFRPTSSQSIKLPMGTHQETGRHCSFLDRKTLLATTDPDYVYNINRISADWFNQWAGTLEDKRGVFNMSGDIIRKTLDLGELPQLEATGTRHDTMMEIALSCKRAGYTREESNMLLQDWYAAQDKQYTTTPEPLVKKDIRMILDWTFSDKCQVQPAKRKPHSAQPAIITAEDMARVLSIRGDISRRFLFYITVWNKVYGLSRASSNFIGQVIGGTDRAIRKTVKNFQEKGYIAVRNGVTTNKGGYVAEANSYFVNEFEGVEIPDEVREIQIEIDTAKVNDAFEVQYCAAIDAFGEWAERHLTPKERRARGT